MNSKTPNIGESGIKSIRLDGRRVDDLPLGQGNEAIAQLPDAIASDRETKISNVKAKYPRPSVAYLESRIREAYHTIDKVTELREQQREHISEYAILISNCTRGIEEIPYDVEALKTQVKQFEDAIKRCDKVIEREHKSIVQLTEVLGLAKQRDLELKNLGAPPVK